MPRPRSPRRHSRSPRRQRDRRHRSSSSRSRSRGRSPARRYASPPAKERRQSRRSLTPPPKQAKYGGRRSRSYSPNHGQTSGTSYSRRSRSPGYQDQRASGRSSPRNYRDPSPDYYQKPKESQIPTYVVVNRDRSYSPDRHQGQQYDDRRDEPRDLDARLREMEARSPEITKPRVYEKDEYSRNSTTYEKSRQTGGEYRRDDRSPNRYQDDKYKSRDYVEPTRKDTYTDNYQASGRSYSPTSRESRDQQRNGSSTARRRSKDAKYTQSPDRYRSPERDRSSYKDDTRQNQRDKDRRQSDQRDDDKYSDKKERSGKDRSSHGNRTSSNRDGYDSQKSHRRQDSSNDKSHKDRESEKGFDPTLVIVPRRKGEGRGGIFNRPEITMRPITDDPDNQTFEEKRVVAVMPGKPLPGPAVSDRDIHRDYLELLARKDFEVRKDKYRDLGLSSPPTLSSRFQGASSSLDLLATLENFEISSRTKNLERELEIRREMELLRDRSPLRLADLRLDLEDRLDVMERKVEPKNPRDLRHDLESRRKQIKAGRLDRSVSPRRSVTKKSEKESKLRMTSGDHRRPVRERLGLSPAKRERRERREVEDRNELPDFKKEVEELQKAQWMEDPKSVPKGPGYFEHDDREGEGGFAPTLRGRGIGFRGRGRGVGFRGRGTFFRGRGGSSFGFRGSFRGRGVGFRGGFRGRGTYRGRSSPQWKHDKFEGEGKEKRSDKDDKRGSHSKTSKKESSSHRSDDRHSSRKDDRKSIKDSRDRRTDRRDTSGSRARDSRDSRKDRR